MSDREHTGKIGDPTSNAGLHWRVTILESSVREIKTEIRTVNRTLARAAWAGWIVVFELALVLIGALTLYVG